MLKYIKSINQNGVGEVVKYSRGEVARLKRINYVEFQRPKNADTITFMDRQYCNELFYKHNPQFSR